MLPSAYGEIGADHSHRGGFSQILTFTSLLLMRGSVIAGKGYLVTVGLGRTGVVVSGARVHPSLRL